MPKRYLLAIDQGTTSTRAVLFDADAKPCVAHAIELAQIYPANGWVEHDPEEIWKAVVACCRAVLQGIDPKDIAGIGITNQRETTLVWERETGKPLYNAIVWQDRRTAEHCAALKAKGLEGRVTKRTGLLLDPYFSATKAAWILDHVPKARTRAQAGELCFGTVDSWLIYKLTAGRLHATDVTNASRTLLLDLARLEWDDEMLSLFEVPRAMLPDVRDSSGHFGETGLFGASIPILGDAGDQQAATFGQACFAKGDVKSTYGTGCFALVNTGADLPSSANKLLATCAWRIGKETVYAIEGSIFIAGAVVQWLRDGLGIIRGADDIEALVARAKPADGLYFVPAFTGLGAPYWDPQARGAILGLTRDTGAAEIARAALDSVCFQTSDLLAAMARDMGEMPKRLKVDGGMVKNDWFCQRLADLTGLEVDRPKVTETTALGAAYLAGRAAGVFKDMPDIAARWGLDRRFEPKLANAARDRLAKGWQKAVARVRS